MPGKYYIIAIPEKKYHDGNDFIIDTIPFFRSQGYKIINTRKYGKLASFFYEFILFFKLGYKSQIITTWPGFPKITINDKLYINYLRIFIYLFFTKLKKWDYTILPIDMHLILAKSRISNRLFRTHNYIEDKVFRNANTIIACGDVLYNMFSQKYPKVNVTHMDMYDQVLPAYNPMYKEFDINKVEIVMLGNLIRMVDIVDQLPQVENIRYNVIGKNGDMLKKLNRSDITYHGEVDNANLLPTLGKFDFGLILYSKKIEDYFSYNIAGKVTSYLLAGLPIICLEKYSSMASLVKRKQLGTVFNDLEEIPNINSKISQSDYIFIKKNCIAESIKIQAFGHYKESLMSAGLIQ